jgi:hypothetical protein
MQASLLSQPQFNQLDPSTDQLQTVVDRLLVIRLNWYAIIQPLTGLWLVVNSKIG